MNNFEYYFNDLLLDLFGNKNFNKLDINEVTYISFRDSLSILNFKLKKLKDLNFINRISLIDIYKNIDIDIVNYDLPDSDINSQFVNSLTLKEKEELYINKKGFYNLILSIDNKKTKPFKTFIAYVLFPSLEINEKKINTIQESLNSMNTIQESLNKLKFNFENIIKTYY